MKKTVVLCDVCGGEIKNGKRMYLQRIVDGRGRKGNEQIDICDRCYEAFRVTLKGGKDERKS